uniref:Putative ubiquitin carboxyl-terminal hydrolase 34 n=1 Tax=Anopheles darlingi TaxID=43151 RepID=A0A2M4DP68_ANODA
MLVSKVFLLNFPLYVAYKHGVHTRLDEVSAQEVQTLSIFCDLHDSEIPAFLLRNVSLFCNYAGFDVMMQSFEQPGLPVSTAHAITATASNIKLWINYRSIMQLFIPLRVKVLQYMCRLSDQDLRSPATKTMADFMWTAIKDPLDSQITFDTEGLALAFKYFTSSTLTMRLAGMTQINAHINIFNDICTSETVSEVEAVGLKLANWLTENQIISHLFGPNLHVEVIKQSHIVLNFLAVENQITEEHISLMWQAAQLKHCSKTIYDILPSLVKNLAPKPAAHLHTLLCRLDPRELIIIIITIISVTIVIDSNNSTSGCSNSYIVLALVTPVCHPTGQHGDRYFVDWIHGDLEHNACAFHLNHPVGFLRINADRHVGLNNWPPPAGCSCDTVLIVAQLFGWTGSRGTARKLEQFFCARTATIMT